MISITSQLKNHTKHHIGAQEAHAAYMAARKRSKYQRSDQHKKDISKARIRRQIKGYEYEDQ